MQAFHRSHDFGILTETRLKSVPLPSRHRSKIEDFLYQHLKRV